MVGKIVDIMQLVVDNLGPNIVSVTFEKKKKKHSRKITNARKKRA
jgi:hypothetical protein